MTHCRTNCNATPSKSPEIRLLRKNSPLRLFFAHLAPPRRGRKCDNKRQRLLNFWVSGGYFQQKGRKKRDGNNREETGRTTWSVKNGVSARERAKETLRLFIRHEIDIDQEVIGQPVPAQEKLVLHSRTIPEIDLNFFSHPAGLQREPHNISFLAPFGGIHGLHSDDLGLDPLMLAGFRVRPETDVFAEIFKGIVGPFGNRDFIGMQGSGSGAGVNPGQKVQAQFLDAHPGLLADNFLVAAGGFRGNNGRQQQAQDQCMRENGQQKTSRHINTKNSSPARLTLGPPLRNSALKLFEK